MATIFYESSDGEYTTEVDRTNQRVIVSERGGWSRDYKVNFDELIQYAKQWDVSLDLDSDNKTVADIATKIVRANNAAEHGGDPFRYVPRTNKITEPNDVNVIKKLDTLLDKYTTEQVIQLMSDNTKNKLKLALNN